MGFPRKYINEGEEVVLDLRPHWSFFAWPGAAVIGALALAIAVAVRFDSDVATYATLVLVLVALAWFAGRWARWATNNFVLTSDRIIHREGVLAKRGKEIPLERLNDVSFHKTFLQRIVGAGDLLIESAGEQGQSVFDHFAHPEEVQNTIHRQIELAQARDADRAGDRAARPREVSPLDQIEKLDELRRRGVISQAEFEAKKAQLLDRL